jgi:2-methylisocitrate lyase-like PEP mutase family enzyme
VPDKRFATVCSALRKPVNVLMGSKGVTLSVEDLATLGVRRISVGAALNRAALGAFVRAAREMREHGTFGFTDDAISFTEVSEFMRGS